MILDVSEQNILNFVWEIQNINIRIVWKINKKWTQKQNLKTNHSQKNENNTANYLCHVYSHHRSKWGMLRNRRPWSTWNATRIKLKFGSRGHKVNKEWRWAKNTHKAVCPRGLTEMPVFAFLCDEYATEEFRYTRVFIHRPLRTQVKTEDEQENTLPSVSICDVWWYRVPDMSILEFVMNGATYKGHE